MQLTDARLIAILGGTGSFGQAMTQYVLAQTAATVRIISRDELKQAQMRALFGDARVRYLLGDVRDAGRLALALRDVDVVFHAAALKHVDKGEYDPTEYIATNVRGTENVIRACIDQGVQSAVFLSSDKAVSPVNLYGATKMVAEKLWVRANGYAPEGPRFNVIRYGNVTGSRGSVVPLWQAALRDGRPVLVTSLEMTRFWITLEDAVRAAEFAANLDQRGLLVVPHLAAYSLRDLLVAMHGDVLASDEVLPCHWYTDIGVRPGEKLAEMLLTAEEQGRCVPYAVHMGLAGAGCYYAYVVRPVDPSWPVDAVSAWHVPVPDSVWMHDVLPRLWHPYVSDTWPDRLDVATLRTRLAALQWLP